MEHSKLTNNINKKIGGILSEMALERLDELDENLTYKISIISNFNDFLKKSNHSIIEFYNNDLSKTTSKTMINQYIIYLKGVNDSFDVELNLGETHIKYNSNGQRNHQSIKKARINNLSLAILLTEKITVELNDNKTISKSIVIYIN